MTPIQYFHIALEFWAMLVCIVAAICVYAARPFEPKSAYALVGMLVADAVLNAADIMTYLYQGRETAAAGAVLHISYFLVFFCGFVLAGFAAAHIERIVVVRGGRRAAYLTRATYIICSAGILVLLVFRFAGLGYDIDEHNLYSRQAFFGVLLAMEGLSIIPILIRVLGNYSTLRRVEFVAFLSFGTLPILGAASQFYVQGISLFNLANALSLILIVLAHQLVYTNDNIARERRRSNERILIYHSQIQPHFIYNSLTAIRASLEEPKKAENLLNHFVGFLRGSMDVLTETECIPAEREFETVENYLFIEQTRFGDKLTVVYDVENTDYLLPAFTVQTVVENAVRHGIRAKEDGKGTVSIRSYATEKANIIEVKDDGVGFDPQILQSIREENPVADVSPLVDPKDFRQGIQVDEEESVHVGLSNVRKRLALMCGGRLEIESNPGEGALVRVQIPKQVRR